MTEAEKKAHAAVLQKQWALRKKASGYKHVKVADGKVETHTIEAPVELAVIIAAEQRRDPDIGQTIPGEGVFVGKYQPKDRDGKSFGKTFNVFAAPEDLTDEAGKRITLTYVDTVKYVAALKDWHGFDGTNYATDTELYKALKDGSYKDGWIIPPCDLLDGQDVDRHETQPDTLSSGHDIGAFKHTFESVMGSGTTFANWYWSCSETRDDPPKVISVNVSTNYPAADVKNTYHQSCRPVRLVAVTGEIR